MRLTIRRPSPAFVVACLALFVALGGPAQAQKLLDGKTIRSGTVTAKQIKRGSITGDRIKAGTISVARLSKSTVRRLQTTPAGEVDVQKLADGAVNSAKVADRTLVGADLADSTIGQAQIATGGVAGAEIADDSVDTTEIIDGRLFGADIGSFSGVVELDVGVIEPQSCKQVTFQPTEVPPVDTASARNLSDDVILVTPEENFLKDVDGKGVPTTFAPGSGLSITARPESPTTIGIVLCNPRATAVDARKGRFQYLTIDRVR